ncbi:MAG: NAD(P)H-dependent oxidoreductase subunit E, partial [Candidatus Binataceae bacterium]
MAANAIGNAIAIGGMMLSAATHEKIRDEIAHFPHARGALLYALHVAREEQGALDNAVFAELAEVFALSPLEVAEVASFYSLFNQPKADAIIQVCTNLPCCLRGARGIVRQLERGLGIKAGGAT